VIQVHENLPLSITPPNLSLLPLGFVKTIPTSALPAPPPGTNAVRCTSSPKP